jgi:hypothetical protein
MGFIGSVNPATPDKAKAPESPVYQPKHRAAPARKRVNWLFSGVLLGAASWLLVLAVIFAALGSWVTASALLGGVLLCALAVWRAGRRLRSDSSVAE